MKSFKEFSQDEQLVEQYMTEVLSIAQRLKKSRMFKRIAAKVKLGRKRAAKKIVSDPKKLFKRAIRQQRAATAKKLLKGVSLQSVGIARKIEIEKKLDKMKNRIKVLESNEVKSHKPSTSIIASFHTPQIHFIDWVKSLEPTQQHLDIVLSQGYIQGVSVILCELIEQSTEPPILVSGTKKNHIISKRIKYIKGDTKNINLILNKKKNKIKTIFHFGEFARIYQSFNNFDMCYNSNSIGSKEVFNFCLNNKIKLVYSATSASLGNNGDDSNLSPYAFTKSKNLELLNNLKNWFGFNYEVIYFYNVYGPGQISSGSMATVIGIFENQYKKGKPLTVVKPGTQTRRFTHIDDTVNACFYAWKKNRCRHYLISNKKSYSILEVAKMFKSKIVYLPARKGERFASALTSLNLSNKVFKKFGKRDLSIYVGNIVQNTKKKGL